MVIKTRSTSLQQAVHYDVLQEALLDKTAQLADLEGRSQRQLQELRTDHQLTQQSIADVSPLANKFLFWSTKRSSFGRGQVCPEGRR